MTDVENQKPVTESVPSYGATAPMYAPPPYMPPPYPTGPVMNPQPVPVPVGFIPPNLPPEEVGITKTEEPGPDPAAVYPELIVSSFDDKIIRKAFIRKVSISGVKVMIAPNTDFHYHFKSLFLPMQVFSVVTIQLLVTFTVVCVFTFSNTVKLAVQRNIWVYLSSYIIFVVVGTCLAVFSSFSRKHPWNLVGLSVVTLSLSYMVGTVASYHDTPAVIIALGSTMIISFTIIIFSAQTRLDFTICNGILLILAIDLLMFGFFSIFFYSTVLQIVYGCLGALLYALFLAVDCQLVMGRQKYSLDPEEYVFGALIIYLDIIMIFLYILMILGGGSKN
ncbi:protein lifeguard 1 isoform X1 [Labeo rohita]|uniref:protein lifeguard 1 isoform X1 n=1 Tax=Labeo rohita TaxID=84645 RepID=UPI0021E24867|nr:protein lifeguard 1 isoform X1 [Labeo rohita]